MDLLIIFDISKLLYPLRNGSPFKATNSPVVDKQFATSNKCYGSIDLPVSDIANFNLVRKYYRKTSTPLAEVIWMTTVSVDTIPYLKATIHKDYTTELGHLPGVLAGLYGRARQHSRAWIILYLNNSVLNNIHSPLGEGQQTSKRGQVPC